MNRTQTFQMALAYLVVLLILGVLYALPVLAFVPDTLVSVPVAVPWFGAVGAVLISLTGVFEHEHDWDANYSKQAFWRSGRCPAPARLYRTTCCITSSRS